MSEAQETELPIAYTRDDFRKAFHVWGKGSPKYSDMYIQVKDHDFQLAHDAIEELLEFRPNLFDEWYLRNHHRFLKMRETDRRRVRMLVRIFFEDCFYGRVELP